MLQFLSIRRMPELHKGNKILRPLGLPSAHKLSEMRSPWLPFALLLSCAFLAQLTPSTSQIVGDKKHFDYDENGLYGPEHWEELDPEWAKCSNGTKQSPIDINHKNIQCNPNIGRLNNSYNRTYAIMQNSGYDIMIKWTEGSRPGAGSLTIDGKSYVLQQCLWHSPSEHTFFGRRYPLELHMVHVSSDGSIAVIGILYQYVSPDPFLAKLTKYFDFLTMNQREEVVVGYLSPPPIRYEAPYYTYCGSLTTPPCTENVTWIVLQEVLNVSEEQVELLRTAVHDKDNARPIQPINGRIVYLYEPWLHQNHASS